MKLKQFADSLYIFVFFLLLTVNNRLWTCKEVSLNSISFAGLGA